MLEGRALKAGGSLGTGPGDRFHGHHGMAQDSLAPSRVSMARSESLPPHVLMSYRILQSIVFAARKQHDKVA
jgi:hypothetical protein